MSSEKFKVQKPFMLHYTIDASKDIDAQIAQDLRHISNAVRSCVFEKNFAALFLVGGFGRGEGGVIQREGRWRPANDYDLELITNEPFDKSVVHELGARLARELGISWVHIETRPVSALPRLKFTMYDYDLKYASLPVEGNREILNLIPDMRAEEMPIEEARGELFTRLWTFIGAWRAEMNERALTLAESEFLCGQLSKALIAIMDARLISCGAYDASYQRRLERFKSLPASAEEKSLCEWAVKYKLAPHSAPPPAPPVDMFFRVKELYLDALKNFYSTAYGGVTAQDVKMNWRTFESLHFRNPRTLAKRLYFKIWKRSRWFLDYLRYNMGVIYLVGALGRDEISKDLLARAHHFLKGVSGFEEPAQPDWSSLQKEALKLRELIWR